MTPQDTLTTLCIALVSLTAGSIFCFPLFGPSLTRDLGLNLTQTNTIWGGCVMGEYLSAAVWGSLGDRYGPRLLSTSAAVIFFVGYQLMAHADVVALHANCSRSDGTVERASFLGNDATVAKASFLGNDATMAKASFLITVVSFVGIGSAVAASYFSAVTASARLFTSRPGLAIAGPLTLFSLSSLFLTSIGTTFFSDAQTGDLDAPAFLSFLGYLLGITNLCAAACMRPPPARGDDDDDGVKPLHDAEAEVEAASSTTSPNERTALLAPSGPSNEPQQRRPHARAAHPHPRLPGVPHSQSTLAFIGTPSVWALGLLMLVGVGASEMVLSSVGNMVVALLGTSTRDVPAYLAASPPPGVGPIALEIRATQVKLLAAANTASRLLGGLLSDFVAPRAEADADADADAPTPTPIPSPTSPTASTPQHRTLAARIRATRISRLTLVLLAVLMSFAAYTWAAFGLSTVRGLPAFSIVVGSAYGLIFTLVPAITVSAFGPAHFGRNWGLLSYCCAAGSFSYSLLYATLSDAVAQRGRDAGRDGSPGPLASAPSLASATPTPSPGGATCLLGPSCFRASFVVSMLGMGLAFLALVPLWRRWRAFL